MTFDEFDEMNDSPDESGFSQVLARRISRRGFLGATSLAAFVASRGGGLHGPVARAAGRWLTFDPVAANTADSVTVPPGFSWHVVVSWGDPLWSTGVPFDPETRGTGVSQEQAFGDNPDGMWLFSRDGRSILVANNEYVNRRIIYGNRESGGPETADDVRKGKAAHGISVMEIRSNHGRWEVEQDSVYNRRITADTPMEITGPARGHDLLKTVADPTGATALGTWNNCGSGKTPWGTYLGCEENFNGYFSSSDEDHEPSPELARYGIGNQDAGYGWARTDERFDISRHPNEPNRAGYVVEIDPFDPASAPKKRTALGRLKHENAELVLASSGHVVVYLGDDERGEFLYRFVSAAKYDERGDNTNLLDDGSLYVARFSDDGRGEWLELMPESTGLGSTAEICIHTRQAGSAVGATTMDRPEWVTVHPTRAEAYCALTNNPDRGRRPNQGGDETPVGGPNPRVGNLYGQIVRWRADDGDHTAPGFEWDLFVLAGNPTVHTDANAGSENLTAQNMFNAPDGLTFDTQGGLWIQTDGNDTNDGDFAGHGNNQMLLGDPDTGEIARFLVGPKECEITGLTWSADRKTMFVGIQHPGGNGNSHFPGGGRTVPRSSIIAVTRDDGGVVG